jgi:predicted MFS family arabinose efflux permease
VLPAVQVSSGSTDGELGTALLMIGLGALVSMRLTGHLVDRLGAGVLPVVMLGFAAAGVLPAFAGSPVALGAALLLLGALAGATDVAINAAGVHAEIRSQRALMNLAHAWFSVGVVVASLNTAALRAAGAGPCPVLGAVFALITAITVVVLAPGSLRTKGESGHGPTSPVPELSAPQKWRPALPLIVFGCPGALAYLVENAWESWGAVYLEGTLDATAGLSSTAPAVFASAVAAGRFAGNAMVRRFQPVRLISVGALTAGAGTLVAATAGAPWVGLAGIAVAGLGTSVSPPR